MENELKTIKQVFGNLPLGYIRRGNQVLVEEKGAAFVQDYFKELLESKGQTLGQVFSRVSKRHDIPIARSFSSRGARNKFYIGIIERDGETYTHPYRTILEPELFYAVQEKFKPRETIAGNPYNFTKSFRCGFKNCGNYLVREFQKGIVYYRCHSTKHLPNSVPQTLLIKDIQDATKTLTQVKLFISTDKLESIFDYIHHLCVNAHTWIEHPDVDSVRALVDLLFTEITVLNKRCTFTYQEPFLSISQGNFAHKLSFGFDVIKDIVHHLDESTVGDESPIVNILNLCRVAKTVDELATKMSLPGKEIRSLLFTLQLEKKIEDNGLGKYKTL